MDNQSESRTHSKRNEKNEYVANFPSHSRPGTYHLVKRNRLTHELSCNCKGWIFSGKREGGRMCRHVRETMERLAA